MSRPIKLIVVSSNASGEDSLDIDKETRVIEQLAFRYPEAIDIIPCSAARASDLVDPLSQKPQIVHIIAHGSDDAKLEFMDEQGKIKAIADEKLRALFGNTQTHLVVLMACFSELQAKAISDAVECVIGMNYKVSNQAATSFVEHFYSSLFRRESVKNAFELAQRKMEVDDNDQFDIPTLIHRPGVEPAEIFIFETPVASWSKLCVDALKEIQLKGSGEPEKLKFQKRLAGRTYAFTITIDYTYEGVIRGIRSVNPSDSQKEGKPIHKFTIEGEWSCTLQYSASSDLDIPFIKKDIPDGLLDIPVGKPQKENGEFVVDVIVTDGHIVALPTILMGLDKADRRAKDITYQVDKVVREKLLSIL